MVRMKGPSQTKNIQVVILFVFYGKEKIEESWDELSNKWKLRTNLTEFKSSWFEFSNLNFFSAVFSHLETKIIE